MFMICSLSLPNKTTFIIFLVYRVKTRSRIFRDSSGLEEQRERERERQDRKTKSIKQARGPTEVKQTNHTRVTQNSRLVRSDAGGKHKGNEDQEQGRGLNTQVSKAQVKPLRKSQRRENTSSKTDIKRNRAHVSE